MRRLLHLSLIMTLILLLFTGNIFAQSVPGMGSPVKKLPKVFQALVPEGHTLRSPQTVKVLNNGSGNGSVTFHAIKQFQGRHSVPASQYDFEAIIMEKPKQLINMQAPLYRKQLEQEIQSKLSSCKNEESNAITVYDPPQLSKYGWGAGITQRVTHQYVGAGSRTAENEYHCAYYGLFVDGKSIKKFKFYIFGVENREQADRWAKQAGETIEKTHLIDLDVK